MLRVRRCLLWLVLAAAPLPVRAACSASLQDVLDGTEAALVAFELGDYPEFGRVEGVLFTDLACLTGVLEPAEIRDIHLVHALGGWLRDDLTTVERSLRSIHALEPAFDLSIEVGVLERDLLVLGQRVAAEAVPDASAGLPVVEWRTWRVEGEGGQSAVPTGRPVAVSIAWFE